MNYTGAFQCGNCPQNSDTSRGRACPIWWETVWTNPLSGETQVRKSCGWQQLPLYLAEVIKASNGAAASVQSTRNELALGFTRLIEATHEEGARILPNPSHSSTNGSGDQPRPGGHRPLPGAGG